MIDVFFFRLLLPSELQLIFLFLGLILVGGMLGFTLIKPGVSMSRLQFFVRLAAANFVLSIGFVAQSLICRSKSMLAST